MAADAGHFERREPRNCELAECAGHFLELCPGLGVGAKWRGYNKADMHLEQVTPQFVEGSLEVLFAVVGTSCRSRELLVARSTFRIENEEADGTCGHPHDCQAAGDGEGVEVGKGEVLSQQRGGKTADSPPGLAVSAPTRRAGDDLDGGADAFVLAGTDGTEKAREGIGEISVESILELAVTSNRENIWPETKLCAPKVAASGGTEGGFWQTLELAVRIGSGELALNNCGKLRSEPAVEGDVASVLGEEKPYWESAGVCLVDRGQGLLHVLGAAGVFRGGGE